MRCSQVWAKAHIQITERGLGLTLPKILDENQKLVDGLAVVRKRQDDVVRRNEIRMRTDIGRLISEGLQ